MSINVTFLSHFGCFWGCLFYCLSASELKFQAHREWAAGDALLQSEIFSKGCYYFNYFNKIKNKHPFYLYSWFMYIQNNIYIFYYGSLWIKNVVRNKRWDWWKARQSSIKKKTKLVHPGRSQLILGVARPPTGPHPFSASYLVWVWEGVQTSPSQSERVWEGVQMSLPVWESLRGSPDVPPSRRVSERESRLSPSLRVQMSLPVWESLRGSPDVSLPNNSRQTGLCLPHTRLTEPQNYF